jgi:DNA-binding SARP family transcriptional activator
VTYRVLGPLEAAVDGRAVRLGGGRQRAVLAVLLLRANQVVPIPALIDAVWGEDPPATAGNLVQGYVSALRKELGRDSIETSEPGYRLP